jgi:spoIIIJ-associated protein
MVLQPDGCAARTAGGSGSEKEERQEIAVSAKKYTVDSIGPRLTEFLRPLLKRAGFALDFELAEGESVHPEYESPEVTVQFKGSDIDLLLTNKAELLLALEQVTMEALRMPSEDHSRISFDANDYRMLRVEELRLSASAAAEKVKHTGAPFFFNPMNSRERRVIHMALRGETELRSESAGFGSHRQVCLFPAGMPSVPPPPPPPPPRPDRDGERGRDRRPGRPFKPQGRGARR